MNVDKKILEFIRTGDTVSGEAFNLDEIGPDCMKEFGRFSWQEFVPAEIRAVWPELSTETRLAVCYLAQLRSYAFEPDLS